MENTLTVLTEEMKRQLLCTILSWAVLLCAPSAKAQTPVEISFKTDPVQVQTGTTIVFTVITVPNVFSITWQYQGGVTLGLWVSNTPSVRPVPQFQGRVTITATTLQIGSAELRDAGQYTVEVEPDGSTGLGKNSKTVTLNVFDAVTGVNLFVPTVAIETKNISLTCTYQTGTEVTFLWTKDGTTLAASSRITITGGSLVINPAERTDAGDYTCTVSNPVSARAATQSLTVYYGPDTPVLTKDTAKDCVGEGDVWAGKTITLTCTSTSLPLAQFSWQFDGQAISSPDTGVLSLQTSSTDQSGRYTCIAKNSVTAFTSEQGTDLVVTDVCLDVGEVVGIVIGSFILLILLIILIILIIRCILVRRRRREARTVQKNNANPQPIVRHCGDDSLLIFVFILSVQYTHGLSQFNLSYFHYLPSPCCHFYVFLLSLKIYHLTPGENQPKAHSRLLCITPAVNHVEPTSCTLLLCRDEMVIGRHKLAVTKITPRPPGTMEFPLQMARCTIAFKTLIAQLCTMVSTTPLSAKMKFRPRPCNKCRIPTLSFRPGALKSASTLCRGQLSKTTMDKSPPFMSI